jgi:hypothetical protein
VRKKFVQGHIFYKWQLLGLEKGFLNSSQLQFMPYRKPSPSGEKLIAQLLPFLPTRRLYSQAVSHLPGTILDLSQTAKK